MSATPERALSRMKWSWIYKKCKNKMNNLITVYMHLLNYQINKLIIKIIII